MRKSKQADIASPVVSRNGWTSAQENIGKIFVSRIGLHSRAWTRSTLQAVWVTLGTAGPLTWEAQFVRPEQDLSELLPRLMPDSCVLIGHVLAYQRDFSHRVVSAEHFTVQSLRDAHANGTFPTGSAREHFDTQGPTERPVCWSVSGINYRPH